MSISVITGLCATVKDKACVPVCPVDCIYEGERQLYIHPEQCIDCGACQSVCPVQAIFRDEEVPAEWKGSIQEAVDFFSNGLPGSQEPAKP
jgi:NAD-dependent dihydropyrimidine dehydrogenase PreA subunit